MYCFDLNSFYVFTSCFFFLVCLNQAVFLNLSETNIVVTDQETSKVIFQIFQTVIQLQTEINHAHPQNRLPSQLSGLSTRTSYLDLSGPVLLSGWENGNKYSRGWHLHGSFKHRSLCINCSAQALAVGRASFYDGIPN